MQLWDNVDTGFKNLCAHLYFIMYAKIHFKDKGMFLISSWADGFKTDK